MPLNILHFSITPLAGQPYRLVKALQRYTNYDVHLVDLNRWNIYPQDLVFSEEQDQCIELAKKADIIHFHNNLDLNSKWFLPLDFNDLASNGKAIIRQMHSEPGIVAKKMNISVSDVLACPIPTLVISQFQERFYKNAYVVRNNIPIFDKEYLPNYELPYWDILFSPTSMCSAWQNRWNTKGVLEITQLLETIAKQTGAKNKIISMKPLLEVLTEKRNSYLVLDDMVTGSYHLSGIEGVSLAKPTLTYLDDRTKYVMMEVSGANSIPFINTRLEDAEVVINYLLTHRNEGFEIGKAGRDWLEKYWNEEIIIHQYLEIYEKLLQNPHLITRQENLRIENKTDYFFALTLPDLVYESRKIQATNQHFIILKLFFLQTKKLRTFFSKVKAKLRREYIRVFFKQ